MAMGAALLLLAVAASSCGTALPTAPAVGSGASIERSARTNALVGPGDEVVIEDNTPPAGGPDIMQQPPAGEVVVPVLGGGGPNGNAWGWLKGKGKAKGHSKP